MYGHSMGGLIATVYMHKGLYRNIINKLILNSPFLYFNKSPFINFLISTYVNVIGYFFSKKNY